MPHIVLPLALSFVTFQQIAFLVDCSRGEVDSKAMSFLDYCLFISFFPQLIAGPIVHHKEMMPQFNAMGSISESKQDSKLDSEKSRTHISESNTHNKPSSLNYEYMAKGLFIFSIGLFKKVFIADSFAKWANAGSKAVETGTILNLFESWAVALSHMFQFYFDFSGYCDMAIGLGLLFGIVLPLNFNSPFKSLSISEFWRRWHITLGRFLKNYVYIPLGGSRVPLILNLRNLFIVFLISGLWHGAGWGFLIWGCIHGVCVVIHKLYTLFYKNLNPSHIYLKFMKLRLYKTICWAITFATVLMARVFYVQDSLDGSLRIFQGMFSGEIVLPIILESKLSFLAQYGVNFDSWAQIIKESSFEVWGWILGGFIICLCLKNGFEIMQSFGSKYTNLWIIISAVILFFISFAFIGQSYTASFLYFNF